MKKPPLGGFFIREKVLVSIYMKIRKFILVVLVLVIVVLASILIHQSKIKKEISSTNFKSQLTADLQGVNTLQPNDQEGIHCTWLAWFLVGHGDAEGGSYGEGETTRLGCWLRGGVAGLTPYDDGSNGKDFSTQSVAPMTNNSGGTSTTTTVKTK